MPKTTLDPIFSGLNEEQRKAVEAIQGPALILAGAGSGKTRTLTHRIAYMIRQGVQPWQILAVTFTNKAANEMKQRIQNLLRIVDSLDPAANIPNPEFRTGRLPTMGTFHSVCVRILRRDIEKLGRDRSFVIYDSDDQEKLMKNLLKSLKIDEKELKPRAALGYIGRFKSEALSPKDATAQATTERMLKIGQVYGQYQGALREANALDFDDLILETVRLFSEVPEVLDRYQETWRYLCVDEYQDTNHAQYLFISLLAQKYRNLCVIGDPDQSIYAFRGADIRNILEFKQEYGDALQIPLERNYRSTQLILTAANAVIAANPGRPEKQMWTDRTEGPAIIVHEVSDERKEAEEALRSVEEKKREGVSLNDQVILYRTNAQSRLFEEACLRSGVPYRIVGGQKFYGRKEVKDVLAYLYVILNPFDTLSLLRIINIPSRKIGETTLEHLQAFAQSQKLCLWETLQRADEISELAEGVRNRLKTFATLITELQAAAGRYVVADLAAMLLHKTEMEKWLRDDTEEGEARWGNVQELLSVMHKYDRLDPKTSLVSFLEEVALISEVDKLTNAADDALTLMTLHLCKGLEFEHVQIAGCEEGIFPHSSSMYDREQLEEERRLMYVGMTRAKTHLRMLFARNRMLYGSNQSNAPSRFLDDLPAAVIERRSDDLLSAFAWASERGARKAEHEIADRNRDPLADFNQDLDARDEGKELSVGDRVSHPSFGIGTVTNVRGDIAAVAFDSGKQKTFALSIAPLTIIEN